MKSPDRKSTAPILKNALPLMAGLAMAGVVDQGFNQGKMTADVAGKVTQILVNDAHAGAGDYVADTDNVVSKYGITLPPSAGGDWENVWGSAGDPAISPYFMGVDTDRDGWPDQVEMTTDGSSWTDVTADSSDPTDSPNPNAYSLSNDLLLVNEWFGETKLISGYDASGSGTLDSSISGISTYAGIDDATGTVYSSTWYGSEFRPATWDSSGDTYLSSLDTSSYQEAGFTCDSLASVCAFTDPTTAEIIIQDMSTGATYPTGETGDVFNFQPANGAQGDRFTFQSNVDFEHRELEDPTTIGSGEEEPVDTDGDGVADADDDFPTDATETRDSDGDGVGDNGDAFPEDAGEDTDADLDGVGANADCDDNDPDRFPGNTVVEEDGVDNNCESDAPSVSRLTIGGLEVYPTITAEPIHFAVGEAIPLEAEGADDETLSSGMTYEWRIQKPNGDYETLTGASAEFTPDENGDYSISLTIRDADGELVTDSGNICTANFSAGELPEGSTLEDGDVIYEDPTNPEGSDSAVIYGDPYVAGGDLVLDDPGDGVDSDGVSVSVYSEPSGVYTYGGESGLAVILGGSDWGSDFRGPTPPPTESSTYGPYVDTEDQSKMTQVYFEGGEPVRVVSAQTWEGNPEPEIDLDLSAPGEYWFADTKDDTPPEVEPGDTGDTGDTSGENPGDGGEDNPETGTPDSGEKVDNKPGDEEKTGCATAPGGAEWYGLGLGALALAGRRRRRA